MFLDFCKNVINNNKKNTLDKWYTQFESANQDDLSEDLLQPLLEDINTPGYISKLHLLYDKASKGEFLFVADSTKKRYQVKTLIQGTNSAIFELELSTEY